jgi:hypothetical protein
MDLSGNFWLFGGMGYNATHPGHLSDLWKLETVKSITLTGFADSVPPPAESNLPSQGKISSEGTNVATPKSEGGLNENPSHDSSASVFFKYSLPLLFVALHF